MHSPHDAFTAGQKPSVGFATRDSPQADEPTREKTKENRKSMLPNALVLASNDAKMRTKHGSLLMVRRMHGTGITIRQRVYLCVNEPHSSTSARVLSILFSAHVVLYCMSAMVETVGFVQEMTGGGPWSTLRMYLNGVFTVEWALRTFTTEPITSCLLDPFFFFDLLCLLPFWLRVVVYSNSFSASSYLIRHARPLSLRGVEAVAMFRMLKLSRSYSGAELLWKALSRSVRELLVPCFMLVIMVIGFSSIMYDIEWDQLSCAPTPHAHTPRPHPGYLHARPHACLQRPQPAPARVPPMLPGAPTHCPAPQRRPSSHV